MTPTQVLGPPCGCGECRQAGVDSLPSVVNTKSGDELHGYPKKRWFEALDQFLAAYKRAVGIPAEARE